MLLCGFGFNASLYGQWATCGTGGECITSGNVGIGTTSPTNLFQVPGVFHVSTLSGGVYIGTTADDTTDTGGQNAFIGTQAGAANTSGGYGTGVGFHALWANTTGSWNTAVGRSALLLNTTGSSNTAIGGDALWPNIDGSSNVAVGWAALASTVHGSQNTAVGVAALDNIIAGNNNTALGYDAGQAATASSGNVFLGFEAGQNETASNKLYIANGAAASNVLIYGDFAAGNVGIGTTDPCTNSQAASITNCKLSVAGAIQAQEIVVNTGWSDYVFDQGYHLAPLSEVASFVKQNHHLPGIPSASDVESKGVSLGEMQSKLLAKIEELTLHMIQADEKIRRLEERNQELEGKISGGVR